NYTSGTTGNPKGVVYHHRGAFLESVGNIMMWPLPPRAVYLWTLPMFHCNGWCYTWALTATGGTHVCLRRVDPPLVFDLIKRHQVTHMCGAPTVLTMLIQTPPEQRTAFDRVVEIQTGGSSPPAKVIRAMNEMGFNVTHLYGLTEVHGPSTLCAWQEAWDALGVVEQAEKMARQGVRYPTLDGQMVADPKTLRPVPADGRTIGEVVLRGNTVMLGYLKDRAATDTAFKGGWFHTGDLAVQHPDGYMEIKDRAKDIIISGGENISSIEVEIALNRHPAVLMSAVVSRPDARYPESVAVAFRDVSLTYRELDALTNRFARALAALGVARGDRVCVLAPNCPEYIIGFYAIARVGAVASPMNPSYREREIEYQLNDTEAVVIVVHTNLVPLVDAVRVRTPHLNHVIAA